MLETPAVATIAVTPEQKKYYEMLLQIILNIVEYAHLTMPLEEAVAEANRVLTLVRQDREKLLLSGIDSTYLDSFEERVGAFVWSAAAKTTFIDNASSAAKEWDELKEVATNVRKTLFKSLFRAVRHDKAKTDAVNRIKKGTTRHDWVFDFMSLHKVAEENRDLLKNVNMDVTLIDKAAELFNTLSDIMSRMVIDPEKYQEAQVICNKAWTYLNEALVEIYAAGQFVFDEDDPRHSLYYSDYYVRLGQTSAKAARDLKETLVPEESFQ